MFEDATQFPFATELERNWQIIRDEMVALRETVTRFRIPPRPFLELLFAFEQDQLLKRYGTFAQLQGASNFTLSSGNVDAGSVAASNGYTMTFNNPTISTGITECQVQVGANATSGIDGIIVCP